MHKLYFSISSFGNYQSNIISDRRTMTGLTEDSAKCLLHAFNVAHDLQLVLRKFTVENQA